MKLFLRVKEKGGNAKIQLVSEGLIIGRSTKSSFIVNDPKISAQHVRVEKNKQGAYEICDLGSSNGILRKGKQLTQLTLRHGMQFQLGDTIFAVLSYGENNWRASVYGFLKKILKEDKIKDSPCELTPLTPPVRMNFISGVQRGQSWTISYLPRQVGKASLDLTLYDKEASNICFELLFSKTGLLYKNLDSKLSEVNGKKVKQKVLLENDVIKIGNTQIEVKLENEY